MLQVEPSSVIAGALHPEVSEQARRRLVLQGMPGEPTGEPFRRPGGSDHAIEGRLDVQSAGDAPEIEHNGCRAGEEVLLPNDPSGERLHPPVERCPHTRVHGHDVPFAARQARQLETIRHRLGEAREVCIDLIGIAPFVAIGEPVILVGVERLFAPAQAPEREPGPLRGRRPSLLDRELEEATGQDIDRGPDNVTDVDSGDTAIHQRCHGLRQTAHRCRGQLSRGRCRDGGADRERGVGTEADHVGFGEDPNDVPGCRDHGQVVEPSLHHAEQRFGGHRILRDGDHVVGRHVGDGAEGFLPDASTRDPRSTSVTIARSSGRSTTAADACPSAMRRAISEMGSDGAPTIGGREMSAPTVVSGVRTGSDPVTSSKRSYRSRRLAERNAAPGQVPSTSLATSRSRRRQ